MAIEYTPRLQKDRKARKGEKGLVIGSVNFILT
jgi:hypothetical protein